MRLVVVLALVFLAAIATVLADGQYVVVQTANGPLRGERRGSFYAFEGVPYARAPVGDLRFSSSELNDARWEDPRDALKPGPVCIQWNHLVESDYKVIGEEDCLFLNIYTTSLDVGGDEALPTIFFIHGGAFMFGNGDFYHPDHVMKKPAVLVTFNYRLGPMGFLSTEDDVIPGNFGLKDQVTALKWVRQNIESFGGHPDNITIVGYSAGSASVQLHYLSPMSRGLFKNGIGHSGSALSPWVLAENSAEKAYRIASIIGCPPSNSKDTLKCLRQQPASNIVTAVAFFFDFLYNPFSPLGVVIEKQSKNNPKPFLVDHPYKLMEKGKFYQVPLLLSVNEAEGLYPGAEFISKPEYLKRIDQEWDTLVPSILDYQTSLRDDETKRNEISQLIRKRYLGKRELNESSFRDFIKIISNRLYFAGVIRSAKLMQAYIPLYLYYDVYKTKFSVGEYLAKSRKNYGCAHGEDVLLVFKNQLRDDIPYTDEELMMGDRFVEMYLNFAKHSVAKFGKHSIPRLERKDLLKYLEIDHPHSKERTAHQLSDEDFWNGLDFDDGMPVTSLPVKTEL